MWYDPNTSTIYSSEYEIRNAFQSVLFASAFSDEQAAVVGLLPLVDGEKPVVTPYVNTVEAGAVTVSEGVAVRNWVLRPLTQQEIDSQKQMDMMQAKMSRASKIDAITVTTSNGNTFDGDERSQDRMARAVAAMEDTDTMPWVLADNSVVKVVKSELREALRLSGSKMAEIWVSVYQ